MIEKNFKPRTCLIEKIPEIEKNECKILPKNIKAAKNAQKSGRTPFISNFIRFFMKRIGIDHTSYKDKDFEFLTIRNNILHGTLIHDNRILFEAEQNSKVLAQKILIQLLKKISVVSPKDRIKKYGNDVYKKLTVWDEFGEISEISKEWNDIKNLFEELDNISPCSKYWDYRYRDFWINDKEKTDV